MGPSTTRFALARAEVRLSGPVTQSGQDRTRSSAGAHARFVATQEACAERPLLPGMLSTPALANLEASARPAPVEASPGQNFPLLRPAFQPPPDGRRGTAPHSSVTTKEQRECSRPVLRLEFVCLEERLGRGRTVVFRPSTAGEVVTLRTSWSYLAPALDALLTTLQQTGGTERPSVIFVATTPSPETASRGAGVGAGLPGPASSAEARPPKSRMSGRGLQKVAARQSTRGMKDGHRSR